MRTLARFLAVTSLTSLTSLAIPHTALAAQAIPQTVPAWGTDPAFPGMPGLTELFPAPTRSQTELRASIVDATWDLPIDVIERIQGVRPYDWEQLALGEAIDPASGELALTFFDLDIGAAGPSAKVLRVFKSGLADESIRGDFGIGFAWSFGTRVQKTGDSILLRDADGTDAKFEINEAGTLYLSKAGGESIKLLDDGYLRTIVIDSRAERFDRDGFLVAKIDADGRKTSVQRNREGHPLSLTTGNGRKIRFTTDNSGNITSARDDEGRGASYSYEAGRLVRVERNSLALTYEWDADGKLERVGYEDGSALDIEYGGGAKPNHLRFGSHTLAVRRSTQHAETALVLDGEETLYRFDEAKGEVRVTDPNGDIEMRTYDPDCGCLQKVDRDGISSRISYDAQGRVTLAKSSEMTIQYRYGARGISAMRLEAGGVPLLATYDIEGNLTRLDAGKHGRIDYTYQNGQVTGTAVNGQLRATYEYDAAGDLVAVRDEQGRVTKLAWDRGGNLKSIQRGTNARVDFANRNGGFVAAIRLSRAGKTTVLAADDLRFFFGDIADAVPAKKKASLDSIPGVKLAGLAGAPIGCSANMVTDTLMAFGCGVRGTLPCAIPAIIEELSPVGSPIKYENGNVSITWGNWWDSLGFGDPAKYAEGLPQGNEAAGKLLGSQAGKAYAQAAKFERLAAEGGPLAGYFRMLARDARAAGDSFKALGRFAKNGIRLGKFRFLGKLLKKLALPYSVAKAIYKTYKCATGAGASGQGATFTVTVGKEEDADFQDTTCKSSGIDSCLTPIPRGIQPQQGPGIPPSGRWFQP